VVQRSEPEVVVRIAVEEASSAPGIGSVVPKTYPA
jgi:hypothetical protein